MATEETEEQEMLGQHREKEEEAKARARIQMGI